MKAFGD